MLDCGSSQGIEAHNTRVHSLLFEFPPQRLLMHDVLSDPTQEECQEGDSVLFNGLRCVGNGCVVS